MKSGVSEIIGQAVFGDGTKASAYRALRPLVCASCGGLVAAGEMFTRERRDGQALRLWPRCQACAPFAIETSKPARSALLKALLTPAEPLREAAETPAPQESATNDERRKTIEAMRKRLGPALERTRRSRSGNR